jgi:hypothetical protein
MMRKATDTCLLCGIKPAIKKNSHIIPKFISSDFLGDKTGKKGYVIDSKTGIKKTIQDSPKEDYILCDDCEAYFSVIETEVAQEIKRLHSENSGIITEPIVIESAVIPEKIFHLFYFSQFWRASISNHEIFKSFKLSEDIEKHLRDELNKFNSSNREDFQKKIAMEELSELMPYGIFTSLDFSEKTKNLIFAPNVSFPFCLIADKFGLVLYSDETSIPESMKVLFNTSGADRRVSILPSQLWEVVMVNGPMSLLAEQHIKYQETLKKLKLLAHELANLSNKEASQLRQILDSEFNIN